MPDLSENFDSWDKSTVDGIIGLPETLTLEFKREISLDSAKSKKELAKDVSAMANASGGIILFGIEEGELSDKTKGAIKIFPISTPDILTSRINDILYTAVSPSMRFRIREIAVDGGFVIAIKIEQSSNTLHMVVSDGEYRYYRRTEKGAKPLAESEVKTFYEISTAKKINGNFISDKIKNEEVLSDKNRFSIVIVPFGISEEFVTFNGEIVDIIKNFRGLTQYTHNALLGIKHCSNGLRYDDGKYFLKIRKDSTISLSFKSMEHPNQNLWYPLRLLFFSMDCIDIAKSLHQKIKTRTDFKIYINMLLSQECLAFLSDWYIINNKIKNLDFCVNVSMDELYEEQSALKLVMDRIWNAMGIESCPLFSDDKKLKQDVMNKKREF